MKRNMQTTSQACDNYRIPLSLELLSGMVTVGMQYAAQLISATKERFTQWGKCVYQYCCFLMYTSDFSSENLHASWRGFEPLS